MRATSTVFVFLSLAGCAVANGDDPTTNRVARNAISFADVTANHAAITQLGNAKFSLNNAAAASMLNSSESREVLDYLVGCALPSGQSFNVTTAGGTQYTFSGDIGLAKSWKSTKLTDKQKRWISACMLARINNQDIQMKISLRGPHHALHVTQSEVSQYSLEEGVFYGNIFNNPDSIVGWSCRGEHQALGEAGPDTALGSRDCAEQGDGLVNQCGWGYASDCFVFQSGGSAQACEQRVISGGGHVDPEEDGDASDNPAHGSNARNTYYKRCHAGGGTNPFQNQMWSEVITVYVENGPPSPVN